MFNARANLFTTRTRTSGRHGFTLVELLVVVSIIALLIAILLPSLQKVREQAKTVVCLTNTKALGSGVMIYASEYGGRLPGPIHPAVYRNLGTNASGQYTLSAYARERQLAWKLRPVMNDNATLAGQGVTDKVSICPVMDKIVPESYFSEFATKWSKSTIRPVHYVINNWARDKAIDGDIINDQPPVGTNPPSYFGFSHNDQNVQDEENTPPVALANIKRAADEWMLADAWYRPNYTGFSWVPSQEGPFQTSWTGLALPYFAPHNRKGVNVMSLMDEQLRRATANKLRKQGKDGKTNTYFFDGHGETVASKRLAKESQLFFYGFKGTVNWNPDQRDPIPAGLAAQGVSWN